MELDPDLMVPTDGRPGEAGLPAAAAPDGPAPRTPERIAAAHGFGEVLQDVGDDPHVDAFLAACGRWLVGETTLGRCGVYLRDASSGRFRGRLGIPAAIDDTVRRLVVGGRTDAVTSELVRTRRPVYVPDARGDARMALAAPRAWNTASLLGVPVLDQDRVVAIFILDGERRTGDADERLLDRCLAFGELVGRWLTRTRRAAQLPAALRELEQERRASAAIARADPRLSALGRTTFNESVVLRVLADVVGRDALRFGPQRTLEHHERPRDAGNAIHGPIDAAAVAAVHAAAAALEPGTVRVVERSLDRGVRNRWVVAPIVADGRHHGVLAVVESGTPLTRLDVAMVRRVGDLLGLGLERVAAGRSRTSDQRHLQAADRLGVVPDTGASSSEDAAPELEQLVAFVALPEGTPAPPATVRELERRLGELRGGEGAVALAIAGGLALVVPAPADGDPRPLREALRAVAGGLGLAGTSMGITRAGAAEVDLSGALHEARAFASWGVGRAGAPVVVVADDLGPARLVLMPPGRAGSMAREVFGPLLRDDPGMADLVATIRAFYAEGRNVRATALRLGVHENTIRYRFNRIHEVTGRDVLADPDDQLLVQAALAVMPATAGR